MNKFRKNLLIGATVLGLGSAAFVTNAHTGAAEQGGQHHAAGGHKWHGSKKTPEQIQERIAKRQAELHDKLKLDANQEPAWKAYIASTTPAAPTGKRPDHAEWAKLSVPERMEKRLARMNEREARMASRLAATKTFYAALTPEQQKIFNENSHGGRHHGKK